jgi:hypothetical protein
MSSRVLTCARFILVSLLCSTIAPAQESSTNPIAEKDAQPEPMNLHEKWKNFVTETVSPLTLAAGAFNGAEAHVTNTDPKYGTNLPAFGDQVGASVGDIVTQNFFADFMLASTFHEDPRYFRRGEQYPFWSRVKYAISRSIIIRTDSGESTFNWSNVIGTSMSAALSNAYYPPASRNADATFAHIGFGILGTGLVDLAPEFWPDFRRKVFSRRH